VTLTCTEADNEVRGDQGTQTLNPRHARTPRACRGCSSAFATASARLRWCSGSRPAALGVAHGALDHPLTFTTSNCFGCSRRYSTRALQTHGTAAVGVRQHSSRAGSRLSKPADRRSRTAFWQRRGSGLATLPTATGGPSRPCTKRSDKSVIWRHFMWRPQARPRRRLGVRLPPETRRRWGAGNGMGRLRRGGAVVRPVDRWAV
jgi:hypothetical protein